MNPTHDFGIWMRQLRMAADLTQEALAEAVACASQTVRSVESGRRRPSRELAARLADVLHVPPSERAAFLRLARTPRTEGEPPARFASSTPPVTTTPTPSHITLPADGLIGRHHELERVRHALLDAPQRLVTLLGPGGVGKTRLALQIATDLARSFPDHVAFVALASVSDSTGIVAAIATAVGCPLASAPDPGAALVTFLCDRTLLLILDNLEHLLVPNQGDAIADLLMTILRGAPQVQLLVTSRERLRLQAEWVVEIGGLGLPPDDQLASIAHSDAVLLFVERARRITGGFALDPTNQITLAQICRRLDGLPLALELAAAQISFLPPATLLARLDHALPLLEGGARDLPARQRTMRATIGWSHDLLSAEERDVFQRLGVLVSSFSLAAAEAIGAGNGIESTEVVGVLRSLVNRSLVVRDSSSEEVRYRLLEPVRQYAVERLNAHPDAYADARQRHATFFQALAEKLGPQVRTPQIQTAFTHTLARLNQEYPNIRTAITWALAHDQVEIIAHIGWALAIFWWYRGQPREPRAWMESVLANPERLSSLAHIHGLLALVTTLYGGDPSRSLQTGQKALALAIQIGDVGSQAYALLFIGLAQLQDSDQSLAIDSFQRAHDLSLHAGDSWMAAEAATCLGLALAYTGQYERARTHIADVLAIARANRDTWNISQTLFNQAFLAHTQGDLQLVAHYCHEWLAFAPELVIVNGSAVAYALESIAAAAAQQGASIRASRLFSAADTVREIAGDFLLTPKNTQIEQTIAALRSQLRSLDLRAAWSEGRMMSVPQAVAYALEADREIGR